jgi:hypothetical protein
MKWFFYTNLCFFWLITVNAQDQKLKKEFKLRPSLSGDQQGWFDAEGLPTSIKINEQWVLPRGGTMEWLMSKGYVPDDEKSNIMKPNPFDNRYRKPRRKIVPSLAKTPVDYIAQPRVQKINDPFAGLSDPLKRKYTPLPGVGANKGKDALNAPLGPVLEEGLPTLKDSPFDAPKPNTRNFPNFPDQGINPANKKLADKLPPTDPFSEDSIIQPAPSLKLDQLPGKKIIVP